MKILALCFVAALWLQMPSGGDAVCCHEVNNWKQCGDCTRITPHCGYGVCNIFGCNCEGGCRTGHCGRSGRGINAVRSSDAHDVIRAADQDDDGLLSIVEACAHLLTEHPLDDLVEARSLEAMDLDKDNFLSAREIDSDAE